MHGFLNSVCIYLFTQVFKENETIMTGGVKLRFKSASFSIDDGLYIAEFLCPKKTNIVLAIAGRKKWIMPMQAM